MNFYLIDDSPSVLNILSIIIRERALGTVCGSAGSAVDALEELELLRPDIVIVDLLMPEMDGITFVKRARVLLPDAAYIMLSQVSSKEMIASAYESGIEFFVTKPVNAVEAENVIRKVAQTQTMRRALSNLGGAVAEELPVQSEGESDRDVGRRAEDLLRRIGILGEAGSRDILAIVCHLAEHPEDQSLPVSALCAKIGDVPKSVEQRLRRAAFSGMVNLANMGLADSNNEVFAAYAGTLYRFDQVRREMSYIAGKGTMRGTVQLKKFLSAVLSFSTEG